MTRHVIPARVREQQINALPNITFVRWDGEYEGVRSNVVCRCAIHNYEWVGNVSNLVNRGSGCPQCSNKRRWTADERIEQINALPNITFVRWINGYTNARSMVRCRCAIDDCEWSVRIDDVVNGGKGCPQCADKGYSPSKLGTLYALRSECGTVVKIGISNDYQRRHRELVKATPFDWLCTEMLHGDGAMIESLEKAFHGMTEQVQFAEPFDGHTEWRKWDPRLPEWFNQWRKMTQA